MSTVLPNRFEPSLGIRPGPVPGQWPDAVDLPSPPPVSPRPAPALPPKKKKISRQLTPQKIGVAWEKVRRVVRDLCRQRGPDCLLCRPYGHQIEFQLTRDYQPITLDLEGDRIVVNIGRKRWTVRIVRIKTGGSAYEFRRQRFSATWLIGELLRHARIDEEACSADRRP